MRILTKHALERLAMVGLGLLLLAGIAGALWLKYGLAESDYQRLNALEKRVDRLEGEARIILLEDVDT